MWQFRLLDTTSNKWGPWKTLEDKNVAYYQARAKQAPAYYDIRPLYVD